MKTNQISKNNQNDSILRKKILVMKAKRLLREYDKIKKTLIKKSN